MSYHVRMCCGFSHEGVAHEPGDEVPEDVMRLYPERCVVARSENMSASRDYEIRATPFVEPEVIEEPASEDEE